MTMLKLNAFCERNPGFTAEVNGDDMTAKIFNTKDSLVMTVKLK